MEISPPSLLPFQDRSHPQICLIFHLYPWLYFIVRRLVCLSGHLGSSASVQKLFCGSCSICRWSFYILVREKVVFPSYSSSIMGLSPELRFSFFQINLFILIGGYLLYSIVVGFAIHWHESAMGVHVSHILKPPPTSLSIPSLRVIPVHQALSALSHAMNLNWRSILHMVMYVFQRYSLKSSHPRLLPQSPKVCSLHLCLFCCLAYRVIVTIFLNSIYMH